MPNSENENVKRGQGQGQREGQGQRQGQQKSNNQQPNERSSTTSNKPGVKQPKERSREE